MIVADASVIVKLVLHEKESDIVFDEFKAFINEGEIIASPEIALVEALNAIWKHYILLKDITTSDFDRAISLVPEIWNRLNKVQVEFIYKHAVNIAIKNKITVYDSLYLAACRLTNGRLFTFDENLGNKAKLLDIKTIKV